MILNIVSLLFILTFCKSSPVQNEEALTVKVTNLEHDVQETKTTLLDLLSTVSQISQNFETVANTLEVAIGNIDRKVEHLKQDILDKLENKVKREQREKFTTETEDVSKSTITKDEFASFQLVVARDTSHIRYQERQWVVFQRRGQYNNPGDYFARDLDEYVSGFGDPSKEFWLGLDKLVSLTRGGAELLIQLETFEGQKIRAKYSDFRVEAGPEYRLHVSGYSGSAGNPLRIDTGMAFSARDSDRDLWEGDCSQTRGGGGWWYNGCGLANLNGRNLGAGENSYDGILWYFYANDNRSFKTSKMMLRKT